MVSSMFSQWPSGLKLPIRLGLLSNGSTCGRLRICVAKGSTRRQIHMIFVVRKEACSGRIHDLAHNPTRICLGDNWTKASAKADNLITAGENRKIMEPKDFFSTWRRTFLRTGRKDVFFLNTLRINLAQIHVMFANTHYIDEQKGLTRVFENQGATTITSALRDSRIY